MTDFSTTLRVTVQIDIDQLIDRLPAVLASTAWRCHLVPFDPARIAAVEARFESPLPDDFLHFLGKVVTLENGPGDVAFLTARDLSDPSSAAMTRIDTRRWNDELSVASWPAAASEVRGFWSGAVPFLMSTVRGVDFLALDRTRTDAPVVEIWSDSEEGARPPVCASSFSAFLDAFCTILSLGPSAFDSGWRLSRATIEHLQSRDPAFRQPLVPLFFESDFLGRSPISRPPPSMGGGSGH